MKNNKYILGTDAFDDKVFSVCLFDAENNTIVLSENIVGEKEFEEKVKELEKCIKEPFAMNPFSESRQYGEQKCLKEIIEYLKEVI